MTEQQATARLADYAVDARAADLPEAARRETLRSFVNIFGCMVGGARHEAVERAERALLPFAGAAQATVVGRGKRTDALLASLLNCLSSSVHTYDDTHAEAIIHPSGPMAAVGFALAERRPVLGADFLLAFHLGVEAACRLSKAVSVAPAKGDIAWSQTGICCGIGAAIAAGKLLGLDRRGMRRAIGIAAAQASGVRAMHGSMCTPMMPALAAQAGLRAALLAEAGFTSSETSLEARYGFAACFADKANLAAVADGLGERFEILANTYKPYPCGIVIHPMIDACLQLKAEHAIDAAEVEAVAIRAAPAALALCDRPRPKDEFEAQVSLQHWVAAALVRGRAGVRECSAAAIAEPAIAALRARVTATADPAVAPDATDRTVRLRDGRRLERRLSHCIGSAGRPMTDLELEAKFAGLAEEALAPEAAARLIAECWRLDELADAATLVRAVA
jgi:2-methylcitrate dehydratase PrpD